LEFRQAVQQGLDELDRGEGVPIEEVKAKIAPSAQADLADIIRYVAQHNSDAAARLGYELITCAENLANFPEIASSTGCGATSSALTSFDSATLRADSPASPARFEGQL
jgi:plasmid stabilization system protein ParE